MNLYQLLEGVSFQTELEDLPIEGLTGDSRQVEPGYVFVCMKGQRFDGHDSAAQALEDGAAAIIVERDLGLPKQVLVPDSRLAYSLLCGNYFGNPSRKLKMVGVTGTNGKTTSTWLLKNILEQSGKKAGLIGTIENEIGDMTLPAKHTTPDPLQLHALLARMVEAGCEYAVMEVSSHALDQHRVEGCHFAASVFTNLTQDHLDYHGTMENYFQAKCKLFSMSDQAIINYDDEYARRLLKTCPCPAVTFSSESDAADYTARNIKSFADGSTFEFLGSGVIRRVRIGMPGGFSVANAMGVVVCCLKLGLDLDTVLRALEHCPGVPGRFEVIPTDTPYTIIRDYAHTPDGIEKILTTVDGFKPARVITVFGCPGRRDRTKRIKMARNAAKGSDLVVLTSDNPREEDPMQIIGDALPGIEEVGTPHQVIPDRYEAITWALSQAQPQDIVLLMGKGHEDYQVLDYGSIYFDEREIVHRILAQGSQK